MNLADLKYYANAEVNTPYLARLVAAEPSLSGISALTGGSTLSMASPRQQRETQAIRKQIQPAINAVTDPVYAFTPGTDQRRQDARRRILEKVAAVTTDPMAATFAGVGAKMADKAALARSLEMKAAGVADREIWQQTGWTHGFPDGKPRFEIDDSAAHFTNAVPDRVPENSSLILSGLFRHNELYENYPNLKKIEVSRGQGSYRTDPPAITVNDFSDYSRETMGHELQHAVQDKEGFAKGGSTAITAWANSKDRPLLLKTARETLDEWQPASYESFWGKEVTEEGQQAYQQYLAQFNSPEAVKSRWLAAQEGAPAKVYQKLAGEVEARLTQRRMSLNAEQRRQRYPVDDMDVKPKDQIVRFK